MSEQEPEDQPPTPQALLERAVAHRRDREIMRRASALRRKEKETGT